MSIAQINLMMVMMVMMMIMMMMMMMTMTMTMMMPQLSSIINPVKNFDLLTISHKSKQIGATQAVSNHGVCAIRSLLAQ